MVCYSRITTKMTNADWLAQALVALGYDVEVIGDVVAAKTRYRSLKYTREGGVFNIRAYSTHGVTMQDINDVGRKYAEIGVRDWARANRFTVTESDGRTVTMMNRRG